MNIQTSYSTVNNFYPSVSKTFCLLWRHRDYKIKQKLMNMLIVILELTLNSCLRNHDKWVIKVIGQLSHLILESLMTILNTNYLKRNLRYY